MRPAEDVARGLVTTPRDEGDGVWRTTIEDVADAAYYVPLEVRRDRAGAELVAAAARLVLARLIERSRAQGAESERVLRLATIATIDERLDAIVKRTPMYGGMEAVELQVLLLLEQRSTLGRPAGAAGAPYEVRDLWTTLVVERGGRWSTGYLFCHYRDKPISEYAVVLGELIALVRERLPLEVELPAPAVGAAAETDRLCRETMAHDPYAQAIVAARAAAPTVEADPQSERSALNFLLYGCDLAPAPAALPDGVLLNEVLRRWPELAALRFERETPRRFIEVGPEEDGRWRRAGNDAAPFAEAVLEAVARVRR